MATGYQKRTDMGSVRQTLMYSNGSIVTLPSNNYGPAIASENLTIPWTGSTFPLGTFIQDYVWTSAGDLGDEKSN